MRGFGRLCFGVGVTGIVLLGWARARPGGWGGPAGEIGQLPDILTQLAADEQCSAELEDKSAAVLRANDIKKELAREVLAGRMPLARAVACYQEIHEHLPVSWALIRRHYPGKTDRERWSRNVVSWVRSEAIDQPDQRETLVRLVRVDGELQRFLEETDP
jgi:hypothetical protein